MPHPVYILYQPGDGQTSCKVWLASVERCCCSKLRSQDTKPIEICWGAQTTEPISTASEPKFTILWGHVEILLFNKHVIVTETL